MADSANPASMDGKPIDEAPEGFMGWPSFCSMAELGRILVIMHGGNAPSDAMLKKWSAAGEFRSCLAQGEAPRDGAATSSSSAPHSRPGRPGLQLMTDRAIGRVHELWPQLADSDPKAIFEQAVARTARQLSAAILPLMGQAPLPPTGVQGAETPSGSADQERWRERIEQRLELLSQDVKDLRREMAQFTALRNNLFTRLDEVIVRSREASNAVPRDTGAADPIAEARRERDMRALKASVDRIAEALEGAGIVRPGSAGTL